MNYFRILIYFAINYLKFDFNFSKIDPILGPAEDLGIRLSYNVSNCNKEILNPEETDETDGSNANIPNKNCENDSMVSTTNPLLYYHIPSLCDMLIGFPTQKGYIAYRKPEIGSWYMNAIVQVFSKHSCDTDLCAMLNMVNSMISNVVTNMGKKQMSEFTSKLTKPYFYFFPGLASENTEVEQEEDEQVTNANEIAQEVSNDKSNESFDDICK